jgi:GDP-4-dehydro-6-deoxy-D-mannose reductase
MRVLVTGGTGFVGTHLAKHLVECRDDVALTYLPSKVASRSKDLELLEEVRKSIVPKSVQHVALDITNLSELKQIVTLMQPDVIYHLAAISFVPSGEDETREVIAVNTLGTLNLLEAVKECCPSAKILLVSSSEVYGIPRPGALPLTEQSELRPISAYGVSKSAAEQMGYKFSVRNGMHVISVRAFPHVGPYQEDRYALSSFARQVAEIKLGKRPPFLEVGNIEVKRDFSDVSDIVRGYREAVLNGRNGEVYNLCSGQSYVLSDLIQMLFTIAGVEAEIRIDPARVRSTDIPEHVGSYQKASKDFGWKPRVETEAMLGSLFAYWLEALS